MMWTNEQVADTIIGVVDVLCGLLVLSGADWRTVVAAMDQLIAQQAAQGDELGPARHNAPGLIKAFALERLKEQGKAPAGPPLIMLPCDGRRH